MKIKIKTTKWDNITKQELIVFLDDVLFYLLCLIGVNSVIIYKSTKLGFTANLIAILGFGLIKLSSRKYIKEQKMKDELKNGTSNRTDKTKI
jgi:hypothetical protein